MRDKEVNREDCRAVRPQNIGLSVFFGQNAQHSRLEGTTGGNSTGGNITGGKDAARGGGMRGNCFRGGVMAKHGK